MFSRLPNTLSGEKMPVRLRFARRPQTLEVELWKRRRWRSCACLAGAACNLKLATVSVPVPGHGGTFDGMPTHAVAPKAAWLQFASPSVRWAPDDSLLAAGCSDGLVRLFDKDGALKDRIGRIEDEITPDIIA